MRRVLGFLLIVRGLAPILIVLVIGLATYLIVSDVRDTVEDSVTAIEDAASTLGDSMAGIGEQFTAVGEAFSDLLDRLRIDIALPEININVPSTISVPVPDIDVTWSSNRTIRYPSGISFDTVSILGFNLIPVGISIDWSNFTVRYPTGIDVGTTTVTVNVAALRNAIDSLTNAANDALAALLAPIEQVFAVFDPAFESLGELVDGLETVVDSVEEVASETSALITGVRDMIGRWAGVIVLAALIVLVLVVLTFAVQMVDDVVRGWRMVRGLPV
ncbi:MAG: hypothetical protein JW910_22575 [Anaerolineae bacterium]|nr:hypothetical protein [Anaerolineae bacterium]